MTSQGPLRQTARRYLLWCANEHIEFRIPEIKSISSMFNIPLTWIDKPKEDPYLIVEMNEGDARRLMSRCMLVRSCYELWGQGDTEEELHSSVKSFPLDMMKPHLASGKTYKVRVETFNRTLKSSEKLEKIESLSYLPFEGKVDLTHATTCLHFLEYYGLHPNEIPCAPYKLFLGRWVVDGQRELINKFSLKTRTYIGNTSMDAQLSFIMANFAQVQPASIAVDPFVGTGSVLVSAAQFGAHVWGWDIDYLTLHARTKPTRHSQKQRTAQESIMSNLEQYGLRHRYLDVVVMDNARPFWREVPYVDAIITDPPYGIRETTERVGILKEPKNSENATRQQSSLEHFPTKITYSLSDAFCDLINFAAGHLIVGGRLVFWLPVFREDYDESHIPSHPCLTLVFNCEQVLTVHSSRRLITLMKTRHPEVGETAKSQVTDVTAKFRDKFFQANALTKEERASMKSLFPRDKRGQGLGYRLEERINKSKPIKTEGTQEHKSSEVMKRNSETADEERDVQISENHQ
ncbi:tRNA (guanine(10)-N2)-methyltransferase [Chionoecetes opilio]|uniref:tRNA (guanine(10)-N(2))-methyltransferase TRMT11 n=1 Tax=Chionoecetes opilio TaxID=41210 RepID=A0A8J4XVN8_CHIOP|nr:tRNA (guanine(10)-N2)-methyltransferase [Chionoecetes opilio]